MMESSEVIRQAVKEVGVKSVAYDMNLSTSLIYKWCEPKDTPDASGADNPLDRLLKIYRLTGDDNLIAWLCQQANGFMVKSPDPAEIESDPSLFRSTQSILKQFSDLLTAVSKSYENDSEIDLAEAEEIRAEWERLKSVTECFVIACERGFYTKASQAQAKKADG